MMNFMFKCFKLDYSYFKKNYNLIVKTAKNYLNYKETI